MRGSHTSVQYRKKALPPWFWRRVRTIQTKKIYERFARFSPPSPALKVLDLGVSASEPRPEVHFFEHFYPHHGQLVAAGVEPVGAFGSCYPNVRYVELERGAPLPFTDQEFDVVFSNAVIEHVGSRDQQRRFLSEILRVGKSAFVTTPNRWYPIEFHTMLPLVHWLHPDLYRPLLRNIGFSFFAEEENLNLLDESELIRLVDPSRKFTLEFMDFLGLPANLILMFPPRETGG